MVRLPGYGERKPGELSGGQRQRVALARAIVNRPRVLLLDEPLGALDLKLREQMQVELKSIQGEVGITFVYVTHDQDEALTMSDRIAVFNEGRIEQVSPPVELYERPATEFVAGFVGVSNLLERDGDALHDPAREDPAARSRRDRRRPAHRARPDRRRRLRGDGHPLHGRPRRGRRASADPAERGGRVARRRAPSRGRRSLVGWRPEHTVAVRGRSTTRGGITVRTKRRTPRTHGVARRRRPARLHARCSPAAAPAAATAAAAANELQKLGKGEGAAQPDLLGRLRRTGMDQAVRTEDRLQGQRQGRRHLRRNGRS